jgi:hypothetical protein
MGVHRTDTLTGLGEHSTRGQCAAQEYSAQAVQTA